MYYTVYKITNLINNKIYIGVHKTNDINDNYMGSGKILKRAQEKYGIENFRKEIIQVFDNAEDMFNMESLLVNEEFVKDAETYNLKVGGEGGWDHIDRKNIHRPKETRDKISKSLKGFKHSDKAKANMKLNHWSKKDPEKYINHVKTINKDKYKSEEHKLKISKSLEGHKHSDNTKSKISESRKKDNKIWIYNLEEKTNKYIKKEELSTYEDLGWIKGRKMKF